MRKMLFSVWVETDLELSRKPYYFTVKDKRLRLISHIDEFSKKELAELYPRFEETLKRVRKYFIQQAGLKKEVE